MNNDYQTYLVVDLGFQINPFLPVVGYTETITDAVCSLHSHPRAQLLYATSGVMNVVVENQIWVVNPLQGLWIAGGVEHQVAFQKNVNLHSVFIDPSYTNNLPPTSFSFDISVFLKQLMFKIISFEDHENITPTQRRIMDVFLDELALISPSSTFLPTSNHIKLKNIIDLLINDVANKETIEYFADLSYMSSRTLSRLFIKELGMSFSDWRIRLKLLEAIKRLGEKQSIKEIAFDLGYETTSAFIFMFKKNLGKTPSNYILENKTEY
ncbi:AraC family transcriptional regulator [Flavobacterium sp. 90]|uniref:AraC family transcriptional regulator n=1 Tax=unclassified Flavobacterium TaxID=196869 RepID=UPI000EB42AD8|nr:MULTISPECIES: helix-turn-helix transcriptional regulator [unclassified Flavobacterium]RKR09521.1 AraC family transcriptional regulator [Flavobacterium sp. 81]TCK53305.1 AraC family transcriptional regulator [Flavobacterium sp. 90]